MSTTHEEQRRLLEALARMGSAGRADGEDAARLPLTFWPVAEHLRAFDPDVVLIVGPRGAGKSELFRAVVEQEMLPRVAARVQARVPNPQKTKWLPGYPIGTAFPSHLQLREFHRKQPLTDEVFLELWIAYFVRVLGEDLKAINKAALAPVIAPQGGDVAAVHAAFTGGMQAALLSLDALDQQLLRENRHIFVVYDELDTLARGDSDLTGVAVRGLVAFWATHTRRWQRLRGKIFLRTDLYDRAATAGGADFAKLAANRTELSWSDRDLYAMLVRRIANSDDSLRDYCTAKVKLDELPQLGLFPVMKVAADARPLVERMVGKYMGANERKGLTYRWLLDHIRDGNRQALPRPLVRLMEKAADVQRSSATPPRWPRLIEPSSLRRALDTVSSEHVGAALDEWPWLEDLKRRLAGTREVPWERRELHRALEKSWNEPWHASSAIRPPADSARELVDYLVEVGVFRARHDGRIDVPDLFLAGLGLKRKGGVAKK